MARYIQDVPLNQPLDVVSEIMENYIYRNRYFRTDWQGEPVYLSTDSAEGGERYLKWNYTNGVLHIEAWMKGTFGKETDLSGGGKKQAYKENLERLIMSLKNPPKDEYSRDFQSYGQSSSYTQQPGYTQSQSGYGQQTGYTQPQSGYAQQTGYTQPQSGYAQQTGYTQPQNTYAATGQGNTTQSAQPVYTQTWMGGNRTSAPVVLPGKPGTMPGGLPISVASTALTYGIIAIIVAFIFPLFGLIMGISTLSKSKSAIEVASTNPKGHTAKKLSIAAIVIAIVMMILSFMAPMLFTFLSFASFY